MEFIDCPYCGAKVEENVIWCRFCLRVLSAIHRRFCPVCDEPIMKTDFHCRFCDARIREEPKRSCFHEDGGDYGDGLCGVPVKPSPKGGPPVLNHSAKVDVKKNRQS